MSAPYSSGAPAELTHAERQLLPEHMRYVDCARFSADSFDNREMQLDAIQMQRDWLEDRARAFEQARDAVARLHSSERAA